MLARPARNRRLANALYGQAFAALSTSPGARTYYDALRARGATHHQALRSLANRLVGILHGCLRHHTHYDEATAWHTKATSEVAAARRLRTVGCLRAAYGASAGSDGRR